VGSFYRSPHSRSWLPGFRVLNRPRRAVGRNNQTPGSKTLRSLFAFPGGPMDNRPQVANLPHSPYLCADPSALTATSEFFPFLFTTAS
jgi:hypothetical protein